MLLPFLWSCASLRPIDTSTPAGLIKMGNELLSQERYEEALTNFNQLKNKYPYNKLALEAELQIANIQFLRESYIEAENAYKLFKEFHPKYSKIDFVTFRIAMSMYQQLPNSIDRDLNIAEDAQIYFKQVYSSYPKSDYAASAKEHEIKCQTKIVRNIYYIANFYLKRGNFLSALRRFNDILSKYPNTSLLPKSLYGAAMSAFNLNKKDDAKKYYNKLVLQFPNNHWATKAKGSFKW